MHFRSMTVWPIAVGFVLLHPTQPLPSQACGSCLPAKQQTVSGTITYRIDSSLQSSANTITEMARGWTSAFEAAGSSVRLVQSGSGSILVYLDAAICPDWGDARNTATAKYLRICPDALQQSFEYFQFLLLHEFGHIVGFASGGCPKEESVMTDRQPSDMQGAVTGPGCADIRAVSEYYNEPPDYCAGGGCTPGYVPYPNGNCSEASIDICGCCLSYSPVVLDLDGDNVRFSDSADGVPFDINGLGYVFRVAFPTAPDDAWLAYDRNGNGKIDSGAELFGNTTPVSTGGLARHGFVALADLDANGDGIVSSTDEAFARLLLWFDANRNGESDPLELEPITQSRVVALSTEPRESQRKDRFGNRYRYRAIVYYADGQQRFAYDVFPLVEPIFGLSPQSPLACTKGRPAAINSGVAQR